MSDSEFLRSRQQEWLAWVETELAKPARSPAQVQSLRERLKAIAETRLQRQLKHLGDLEARGIPKAVAEELVVLHARLEALDEVLKHPDRLIELVQKQAHDDRQTSS